MGQKGTEKDRIVGKNVIEGRRMDGNRRRRTENVREQILRNNGHTKGFPATRVITLSLVVPNTTLHERGTTPTQKTHSQTDVVSWWWKIRMQFDLEKFWGSRLSFAAWPTRNFNFSFPKYPRDSFSFFLHSVYLPTRLPLYHSSPFSRFHSLT